MLVICGRSSIRPLNTSRSATLHDVSRAVGSDRPVCIRLNYQLLLRATRPADADREIRTLLGHPEPVEASPPDTQEALRYFVGDYNPLGQFGGAAARRSIR
jgi:hypothetical protein